MLPRIAFLCDTTPKVFQLHPELLDFSVIIVECTFVGDETYELAHTSKHTHWNDLKPIVEQNHDVLFILTHFSMRYPSIPDLIPNHPDNVILWDN